LGKLPNKISIEGTPIPRRIQKPDYGKWELSPVTGQCARRLMPIEGHRQDQVSQVRGYADQSFAHLMIPWMRRTQDFRESSIM